ncbi:glucokinase [Glacieibacterium sp.]|uniref:glucokinase n=1 Tax=Glacieibacterium sp. TaxID=2860237 RepID=UPI003AFF769F
MTEIVAVDIGGTHARFAIATIEHGKVVAVEPETVLKVSEHASLETAWETFGTTLGRPLPTAAGIAVACPTDGAILKLANNPWIIRPALLPHRLGLAELSLCNDFAAVGHAVAQLGEENFTHLCGPDIPLPRDGVVSILGPGTGLGVSLLAQSGGSYQIVPTEGGHTDYAPLDRIEDMILNRLRSRFRRVSVERMVAGPALVDIYAVLAGIEGRDEIADDKTLWQLALTGQDSLAVAALDRFCLALGAVAGDVALTQGAKAVVIAGGLGLRLKDYLPQSGFCDRFRAKGRFEALMTSQPVKLLTYSQPGLYGAAAAFAVEHADL